MKRLEAVRWVAGVVGKRGVEGVNENGEHLVDVCTEKSLLFQHRLVHRYTQRRKDEMSEPKSLIT